MQRKSLYQDIRKIREDMTQPEIIYEDEAILVCHKPAGVATQTKRLGQKDMESILKNYIVGKKRVEGSTQPPYIGIVHRLDQPVEGVMVYAKTPQAAAKLTAQIKNRFVGKHYYALVQLPEGKHSMEEIGLTEKGVLENEIVFDAKKNISSITSQKTKNTKHALLNYEVVAQKGQKCCWILHFIQADITRFVCSWHMREFRLWEMRNTEIARQSNWDCVLTGSPLRIR